MFPEQRSIVVKTQCSVVGYRQEIEALTKVYRKLLESHTLNGPVPAATTQLPSMQANTVKGEVSHNGASAAGTAAVISDHPDHSRHKQPSRSTQGGS